MKKLETLAQKNSSYALQIIFLDSQKILMVILIVVFSDGSAMEQPIQQKMRLNINSL